MAQGTKIEWCDDTWNIVVGCTKVSTECKQCYAIPHAYRLMHNPNKKVAQAYKDTAKAASDGLNWTGKVNLREDLLTVPLRKKKPTRYFVNSMSDLFHDQVPFNFLYKVFEYMHLAKQHTFFILTKRPERMLEMVGKVYFHLKRNYQDKISLPIKNVWLGVSAGNQEAADERIPLLLDTPAAIRFVSCEPLLGAIELNNYLYNRYLMGGARHMFNKLDWVIAGAESGQNARPMDEYWVRLLQHQCQLAHVSFFYKQRLDEHGEKVSLPLLDGVQYAQFPSPMLAGLEE